MTFVQQLLDWYIQNHRKLPWRATSDPYAIWISEVMLQQTQVDTVINYYNKFIHILPNVQALAQAKEDQVLKLWEGLGYYSRAKKLMCCAKVLVDKYDGIFPQNYEEMVKLPGIGPYTAGAILSIAFNQPLPAVDGNVMRVFSRYFNIKADISDPRSRKIFEEKVATLLPENSSFFNQALMELGATICSPKKTSCEKCPIAAGCQAFSLGIVNDLPVKTQKSKKVTKQIAIAYVRFQNKVFITKRSSAGLLGGGLWGFPILEAQEMPSSDDLSWELDCNWGLKTEFVKKGMTTKHVFTHIIWQMQVYEFEAREEVVVEYPQVLWVTEENLEDYPFPTAFKKLFNTDD